MSVLPISVPTKRLATAITSSALSFAVNNIKDWAGNNLTAGQFGTLAYVVLRNSTNTAMEIVEIDATTIANATITITKRGLDFVGGTTSVPANQLAWPANDTLVDFGSDPAQLLTQGFLSLWMNQTVNGLITFVQTPLGINPGGQPDASTSAKGVAKMSVAPASATNPIAVGDNDTRVPTAGQAAALPGDNADIAVGAGNKFVTQTGLQKQAENFATSTGSANAYVVALSPVPTSYAAGMVVRFKANFSNTGSATVNVNSLGAITIKKADGATNLVSGDIANGQTVELCYDGTNFMLVSPIANLPTFTSGVATRAGNTSSGAQTIAHGLGKAPRYIRITVTYNNSSSEINSSVGTYNGSNTQTAYLTLHGTTAAISGNDTTNVVRITDATGVASQVATAAFDGTNITLTWTYTTTLAATNMNILWEAFA